MMLNLVVLVMMKQILHRNDWRRRRTEPFPIRIAELWDFPKKKPRKSQKVMGRTCGHFYASSSFWGFPCGVAPVSGCCSLENWPVIRCQKEPRCVTCTYNGFERGNGEKRWLLGWGLWWGKHFSGSQQKFRHNRLPNIGSFVKMIFPSSLMECPILQWDELGNHPSKILACFSLL